MTYATDAALLASDGMDEPSISVTDRATALAYADDLIDQYCGTSFTYKAFSVTLDGNASMDINTGVLFPRTLTAVTIDGVDLDAADWAGWGLHEEGLIMRDSGVFPWKRVGRNITIAGTAGATATASPAIAWVALTLARQHILDQVSRIPDRALSVVNEFGNVALAQAGGLWKPTNLPDINAVLNRNRHRAPRVF